MFLIGAAFVAGCGFLAGSAFGMVLSAFERKKRLEDLSLMVALIERSDTNLFEGDDDFPALEGE